MLIEMKTATWHELNADGTPRAEHCCGCWHVRLDEDEPLKPHAVCNECGEIRTFVAPGVA